MMLLEKLVLDKLTETLDQLKLLEGERPPEPLPYPLYCPGCGAPVIRQELLDKGCYLCQWTSLAVSTSG